MFAINSSSEDPLLVSAVKILSDDVTLATVRDVVTIARKQGASQTLIEVPLEVWANELQLHGFDRTDMDKILTHISTATKTGTPSSPRGEGGADAIVTSILGSVVSGLGSTGLESMLNISSSSSSPHHHEDIPSLQISSLPTRSNSITPPTPGEQQGNGGNNHNSQAHLLRRSVTFGGGPMDVAPPPVPEVALPRVRATSDLAAVAAAWGGSPIAHRRVLHEFDSSEVFSTASSASAGRVALPPPNFLGMTSGGSSPTATGFDGGGGRLSSARADSLTDDYGGGGGSGSNLEGYVLTPPPISTSPASDSSHMWQSNPLRHSAISRSVSAGPVAAAAAAAAVAAASGGGGGANGHSNGEAFGTFTSSSTRRVAYPSDSLATASRLNQHRANSTLGLSRSHSTGLDVRFRAGSMNGIGSALGPRGSSGFSEPDELHRRFELGSTGDEGSDTASRSSGRSSDLLELTERSLQQLSVAAAAAGGGSPYASGVRSIASGASSSLPRDGSPPRSPTTRSHMIAPPPLPTTTTTTGGTATNTGDWVGDREYVHHPPSATAPLFFSEPQQQRGHHPSSELPPPPPPPPTAIQQQMYESMAYLQQQQLLQQQLLQQHQQQQQQQGMMMDPYQAQIHQATLELQLQNLQHMQNQWMAVMQASMDQAAHVSRQNGMMQPVPYPVRMSPMMDQAQRIAGGGGPSARLNGFAAQYSPAMPPSGTLNGGASPMSYNGSLSRGTSSSVGGGGSSGLSHTRSLQPSSATDQPASLLLQQHKHEGKRPTATELQGHVVEFSRDSHGSRLVQYKMESGTLPERRRFVEEVLPHTLALAKDLFGNYVIQNMLEHAEDDQREELAAALVGNVSVMCTHPHGCRVVQRALIMVNPTTRNNLIDELLQLGQAGGEEREERFHLVQHLSRDAHATHVLQKAVALLQMGLGIDKSVQDGVRDPEHELTRSARALDVIETCVQRDSLPMMQHQQACRLVQRILTDLESSDHVKAVARDVFDNIDSLAIHQNGNFVLQHILETNPVQGARIQQYVCDNVVRLSRHKFGSHLVEKCLSCATAPQCDAIVIRFISPLTMDEMNDPDMADSDDMTSALSLLMKDPYANFVVQKAFDVAVGEVKMRLSQEIKNRAASLSKFSYGRHILLHVNRATTTTTTTGISGNGGGGGIDGGFHQQPFVGGHYGGHPHQQQ